MALPTYDPTKPEVRAIFDQMVRDPWFPVSGIPKHYQPTDRLPDPPLAIEAAAPKAIPAQAAVTVAGGEDKLPKVTVTEGGKELPLTGQLMLPAQRRPPALASTAATTRKEN